jgi:predicted flap endonuclease-1-like 5' DNA nuclease
LQESTQRLELDNEALIKIKNEVEQELERARRALTQSQQTFNHNLSQSNETNELLRKELAEINRELIKLKESQEPLASVAQLENDLGAFRFRLKQLEFQKQELEEANLKLKNEVESHKQSLSRSSLVEPMHPFVRPPEMSEKDDLTLIKGIGPFIEKRLNMLGIYTFRQISEFTPETIEHISKAIEFFPKRIVRDNWVGQAKDFCSS